MPQQWSDVTFLHWPVDAETVQRRLPDGLAVDTIDGRAWVGLVPFHMVGIAPRRIGSIPYLGTFPETNVRTYVIGPDGTPGVWFDSLGASRLLPVLVARVAYRLPYYWATMRLENRDSRVIYESRRKTRNTAITRLAVEVGESIPSPGPLAESLTARWQLFVAPRCELLRVVVDHPPWPLHRAEIAELNPGPIVAAGYPRPTQPPVVLYSPGVPVRVSNPMKIGRA